MVCTGCEKKLSPGDVIHHNRIFEPFCSNCYSDLDEVDEVGGEMTNELQVKPKMYVKIFQDLSNLQNYINSWIKKSDNEIINIGIISSSLGYVIYK